MGPTGGFAPIAAHAAPPSFIDCRSAECSNNTPLVKKASRNYNVYSFLKCFFVLTIFFVTFILTPEPVSGAVVHFEYIRAGGRRPRRDLRGQLLHRQQGQHRGSARPAFLRAHPPRRRPRSGRGGAGAARGEDVCVCVFIYIYTHTHIDI